MKLNSLLSNASISKSNVRTHVGWERSWINVLKCIENRKSIRRLEHWARGGVRCSALSSSWSEYSAQLPQHTHCVDNRLQTTNKHLSANEPNQHPADGPDSIRFHFYFHRSSASIACGGQFHRLSNRLLAIVRWKKSANENTKAKNFECLYRNQRIMQKKRKTLNHRGDEIGKSTDALLLNCCCGSVNYRLNYFISHVKEIFNFIAKKKKHKSSERNRTSSDRPSCE